MSELQKFQNTSEWRNKLRNFLLRESQPQQVSQAKGVQFTETNRYSFDISDDLKRLINEAKSKKIKEQKGNMAEDEDKENLSSNKTSFKMEKPFHKREYLQNADDTVLDCNAESMTRQEISDESFEAMELMCNKTASDPDSTLFQYLHGNVKQDVMANVKKRVSEYETSQTAEEKCESAALDRLLDELRMNGQKEIADESVLKGVEMTQIEDIEAPSHLWDNDTILQTSPVKMVGLLRPSTILECADEMSDASSAHGSFKSAQIDPLSEVSSSCYETASDTTYFYNQKCVKAEPDFHTTVNLIDFEKTIQLIDMKEDSIEIETQNEHTQIKLEDVVDLTIDANNFDNSDQSEESVIEVLSDDEQPEDKCSIPLIKFEDVNLSSLSTGNECAASNASELDTNITSSVSNEQSLHFNDTLEEVEYMMQKGFEFMAGAGMTPNKAPFKPETLPSPKVLTEKQRTFTVSPAKSPCLPPKTEVPTPLGTSRSQAYSREKSVKNHQSRFELNIKPIPKLDLFKKPSSPISSAGKAASRPKDKFAYVVSPIGAYIKKSAEAPLMSTIKTGDDDKNSSAFRKLEFESRQYKPHFGDQKTQLPKIPRSLPKKAYISSEYRQVVDERKPVTIPAGKSVQKYLGAAVLPAVVQHDGKANLASATTTGYQLPTAAQGAGSQTPRRAQFKEDSFADLSVVTGDVSLYTLKDAKKF